MIVVSDTSPIRALAALGALAWLQELFGEVIVPHAVADELLHAPGSLTSVDVSDFPWMVIRSPANAERVNQLRDTLDAGESQAIALAEEYRADWVLIDELAGRAVAGQSGLSVTGTLGVILKAHERQLCAEVRPLLDRLQNEARFFISPKLRESLLKQVGEVQ